MAERRKKDNMKSKTKSDTLDLMGFLFEKNIPFKWKRRKEMIYIVGIHSTLSHRGEVKIEIILDCPTWKVKKQTTPQGLYKNALSKLI